MPTKYLRFVRSAVPFGLSYFAGYEVSPHWASIGNNSIQFIVLNKNSALLYYNKMFCMSAVKAR